MDRAPPHLEYWLVNYLSDNSIELRKLTSAIDRFFFGRTGRHDFMDVVWVDVLHI